MHEDLKNTVSEKGYITLEELKALYPSQGELLTMNLNFLISKNAIRQVSYKSKKGNDVLYYLPKEMT